MRRQDPLIIHADQVEAVGGGGEAGFGAIMLGCQYARWKSLLLSTRTMSMRAPFR